MIQSKTAVVSEASTETEAYKSGWHDGRFGPGEVFAENQRLAGWTDFDRLAYYRGHREGRRIRTMLKESMKGA
ncbi:hypothetical protein BH20ACT10_BH20ACT10_24550 [soil metagenome]